MSSTISASPSDSVTSSGTPAPSLNLVVELATCDGVDGSSVAEATRCLGAEVRLCGSPEAWIEQNSRVAPDEGRPPADLLLVLGGAERIAAQRWIARCRALSNETLVVAALLDPTLDLVSRVMNQGAQGLVVVPNSPDRLAQSLRELLDVATRSQPDRHAAAKHRRALATLTRAEQDVLEGMLAGSPNKKIATDLSIGLRTVELRRSKIMRKMGAKSLSQLISFVCSVRSC